MKYKINGILIALTVGVFASSLAFAGNEGTVTQSGDFNSGIIQQPGDGNASTITQTSTAAVLADGNVAEIDQLGDNNGTGADPVTIDQDGLRNQAFINQLIDATGNDADVNQFGDDNKVVVQQGDGLAGATDNTVEIDQGGIATSDSNLAKVLQTGNDNGVDIDQTGTGSHVAYVGQSDSFQTATVDQSGSDNFALVLQGATPGLPGGLLVAPAIP